MPPQTFVAPQSQPAPSGMTRRQAARVVRRTSYAFLRTNKDVLWMPVIHSIVISIIGIIFVLFVVLPAFSIGVALSASHSVLQGEYWAITALWYFVTFFVTIFFQASLMSIIRARLSGQPMGIGGGFSSASARLHVLFIWALISSTVGIILHILSNSHKLVAQIIGFILGATWSITTYFALPGIVLDDMGPFAAMGNSADTIKKAWGESILSIGGVFLFMWVLFILFCFAGVVLCFVIANYVNLFAMGIFVVLFILGMVFFTVWLSTLSTVLKVVLYEYASDGKTFPGFAPELLTAIASKRSAL